ncbi:acyl-CoA dehydrogenase NM domain-like protein [Lindgomyces ingoldianus]|uniref:Acyl-CoA dehydrogenase NM domain-like protein n=1 Tax=Lindgomyces ingoldianus TaxID=673940 RepID=A0ACB6REZ5_9PLEO|nr:acyl-CoA dehydrogenase NM domain-like protein [Lindgomyces ingoldianus]KAF2477868.1 acyl-CoA dehydrogenase NM domain-like protein [Lindgomyces ingoldianus]
MTLLDAHLEQISLCAASIAELPYDPSGNRRNTTFNLNGGGSTILGGGANAVRAPRRNTAVAAVLGTDLVEKIRRGGGGGAGTGLGYRTFDGSNKNEVDVEVLLEGAEKLLGVYPIPGARERIASMRQRHRRLEASIEHYEYRIAEQTTQLGRLNRSREYMDDEPGEIEAPVEALVFVPMTEEDLKREEDEVRQLEQKKRGLEDRNALRNGARGFAQQVLAGAPKLYSKHTSQTARFEATRPIYRNAVEGGLIKGQIPTELGGTSNNLIDAAIVIEEFFAVEPSAALTILGTGLGLTPLILAGSAVQHDTFLKPFLSGDGEPLAAFVHSEPGGTANWLEKGAPGLQTTAWKDGNEWVVNGEKLWTTNSGGWGQRGADLQCVVCRQSPPNIPQDPNSDPVSNILILIVTGEEIANNEPSAYTVVSDPELVGYISTNGPHSRFTNFRVPSANLLCPPGRGAQTVEQTFGCSAALVGAMSVGIMRAAFEAALKFCKADARGGTVPIIKKQSVADKLIDIKMRVEAARALTWKALSTLENGPCGWENKLEIALEAKIWCSDQAPKAVVDAMSIVGMKSYDKDLPFSRLLEDAVCLPLFDGGNIGVRRRQLERIFQKEDYEPWAATYT